MIKETHSLRRTSPKGGKFLGTCVLCGAENMPLTAALEACMNPGKVTENQALIDAIEGKDNET